MPATITTRALGAGDLSLFDSFAAPGAGPALGPPGRSFLATAGAGSYRPGWTWVAERDGCVVARAAWWAGPDDTHPYALDWFDVAADLGGPDERVAAGAALLAAARPHVRTEEGGTPEYHLFLPPGWRDDPAVRVPAEERMASAARVGLTPFVERLRVEWHRPAGDPGGADGHDLGDLDGPGDLGGPGDPGRPPPAPGGPVPDVTPGGLVLRPVGDDELLAVLERVCAGTLDAYTRRDIAASGVAAAARTQLEDMLWMPAPRDWWRLASTPGGELAGVVLPSRNHQAAVVGYVGVVPEQRGHGHAADLVAWATAFLAAQGADRILADTDTGNTPMAAAFARAGYTVTAHRVVLA